MVPLLIKIIEKPIPTVLSLSYQCVKYLSENSLIFHRNFNKLPLELQERFMVEKSKMPGHLYRGKSYEFFNLRIINLFLDVISQAQEIVYEFVGIFALKYPDAVANVLYSHFQNVLLNNSSPWQQKESCLKILGKVQQGCCVPLRSLLLPLIQLQVPNEITPIYYCTLSRFFLFTPSNFIQDSNIYLQLMKKLLSEMYTEHSDISCWCLTLLIKITGNY